jgi:hypothetical protein
MMKQTTKENLIASTIGIAVTFATYLGLAFGAREQGMSIATPHITPSNEGASVVAGIASIGVGLSFASTAKVLLKGKRLGIWKKSSNS